jgi:hypothetical protein
VKVVVKRSAATAALLRPVATAALRKTLRRPVGMTQA